MKNLILITFILITSFLLAQFNDPVQVNTDLGNVYYRGNEACKIVGEEVYMTFVEDSLSANLYFSYSEDGLNFSNTLIDENIFLGEQAKPTIEVLPYDKIIIFYIIQNFEIFSLFKSISYDNGISFYPEVVTTGVDAFSTYLDGGELYLSYEKVRS